MTRPTSPFSSLSKARKRQLAILIGGSIAGSFVILAILIFWPIDDTVIIVPTFTKMAYQRHGFYEYYCTVANHTDGSCKILYTDSCGSECLTVSIPSETFPRMEFVASKNAVSTLRFLGYSNFMTDRDVTEHPLALNKFSHVIVLHSEYVTQREYNAIMSHPNVTFLYPNALYAEVSFNEEHNSITLIRGHGYNNATNAFGWKYNDSTKDEYDIWCDHWHFTSLSNGRILNCYPENRILYDPALWLDIKFGRGGNIHEVMETQATATRTIGTD